VRRRAVAALVAGATLTLAGCGGGGGLRLPDSSRRASVPAADTGGSAGAAATSTPTSTSTPVSGLASAPAGSTPTPPPPPPNGAAAALAWGGCPGKQDKSDQCVRLAVPLDRSAPAGRKIDLALIRRPAGDRGHRLGSLLLNPGGPGGSTVQEFDGLTSQLSPVLRERFDVVGFDPRGVGSSSPVQCLQGKELDALSASSPDPLTPTGVAEVERDARVQVQACSRRSGDLLPFVGTADAARDMDDIRAAVGDDRLTYLGYSYGTLLGATYASLFPRKVRALVLDGAVDPGLGPIEATEVQAVGFETALQTFLADCQRRRSTCGWDPGGDLLARYRALAARIAAAPLPTGDQARPLTASLALTGVAAALYSRDSWTYLEQGLAQADRGNGRVLLALADFLNERAEDGTYSSLVASNTAVNCRDESAPRGTAPYVQSYRRLQRTAPDFAALALSGYVCAIWPARQPASPAPLTVRGAPPLLVVGSTGDPATPFSEAQALTKRLPGSVLLTRQGEGHTGYGASACVRAKVDAYLVDPAALPPAGTICPS